MKYIITESRLNQAIYEFMDELFGTEIHTLPALDDNGDELVDAYDFVNDEYYGDEGSDYLFSWTGEGYYKSLIKDGHINLSESEGKVNNDTPSVTKVDNKVQSSDDEEDDLDVKNKMIIKDDSDDEDDTEEEPQPKKKAVKKVVKK